MTCGQLNVVNWQVIVNICVLSAPKRALHIAVMVLASVGLTGSSVWSADNTSLKIETVNFAPHCRLRPGKVTAVRAEIKNTGTERAEGVLIVRVNEAPTEEGSRVVILEPGKRKFFDVYVRVPLTVKLGSYINLTFTLTANEGGRQVMLSGTDSSVFQSLRLQVEPEPVVTALLSDPTPPEVPNWDWKLPPIHDSYEMAIASRLDAEYSRRCVILDGELVPCQMADWDTFDNLVIMDDSRLEDEATLQSVKQFLYSGGRVWVMLDRVRCETIRGLLADGQNCEEVDTIELNKFTMDAQPRTSFMDADRTVVSEVPIKFKRVLQQGGEVFQSIDGWPAAMWMPVGHGTLLLTTLGPRGWLIGRPSRSNENERQRADLKRGPEYEGPFALAYWSGALAAGMHEPRIPLPLDSQPLDYPLRHIGNPILPKAAVIGTLLSFCAVLILVGVWQYSRLALNQVGWIAPVVSLFGTIPLVAASAWIRRDIQDCASRLQIVEVLPGQRDLHVREKMAMYMGSSVKTELVPASDAMPIPPAQKVASGIRRWAWEDFQKWKLTNVSWPTGLWRLDQEYVLPADNISVEGEFVTDGLQLRLPTGIPSKLEDAILSFVPGDPAICTARGDGTLIVGDTAAVSGDKWIAGSLVTDEQTRRIEIYKQLLTGDRKAKVWSFPSLMGWTSLWPQSPKWQHAANERGAALVSLPVKLRNVKPGEKVLVPHSLIRVYRPHTSVGMSAAFNDITGRWNEPSTMPASVVLRYELPSAVVPLRVESCKLELQLRAPQRTVTVSCLQNDRPIQLASYSSPSGSLREDITDPQILADLQDGSVMLRLDVSDRTGAGSLDAANVATWEIDHLRLTVQGTTEPRVKIPM